MTIPLHLQRAASRMLGHRLRLGRHECAEDASREISRAAPTTPASRAQLGEHDRQVAGGQRQRPPVDDAAHLGEQRVAEPGGDPAADDDHARVEEADQAGEQQPEPAAAVADQLEATGSPAAAAAATSAAVSRAGLGQPVGERSSERPRGRPPSRRGPARRR